MNMTNKIAGAFIAAALAVSAFSQDINVITYKNVDNKRTVVTNTVDAIKYITEKAVQKNGWHFIEEYSDELRQIKTVELMNQIEDIFFANKVCANPAYSFWSKNLDARIKMPKLVANWKAAYIEKFPELAEVIQNATTNKNEMFAKAYAVFADTYYAMKTHNRVHPHPICSIAMPFIRMQLRREGKTFTTKDKVNPIQERMDAIVTAANAYRLHGFDLALKNAGFDFGVSFEAALAPENDVNNVKEEVLNGTVDFASQKDFLRLHLGVEEFNKFVDEYNNGTAK